MRTRNKVLSILSVTAMSAIMATAISMPAKATDADIYLLNDLLKPIYTKAQTANFANQKIIGLHSENYGYELNKKIYRFDDLTEVFNASNNNLVTTLAALPTAKTPISEITGQPSTSTLIVESVNVISATAVKVKFNKVMSSDDKTGLTYTFNGVAVPTSKVTYSGITATLTGLKLVSSTNGTTPAYEVLVKSGTTLLSKQNIVWNNVVTQNSLINMVVAIPDVSVSQNGVPVLPSIIDVIYKDGTAGKESVTWASVSTSTAGIKKVTGKIDGSTVTAYISVNVTSVEYVKDITLEYYSILSIYTVNAQADSSVARMSLNGIDMYYNGNYSFKLSTLLTKGSTVTFNAYDAANKLLGSKKYVVLQ
ncbi:Ig-like domain-containing protein [Clostridium estertheticum]|uniref:Ig-like domain-containing protein n=1 Tax=Clostridium estertheticum TaxID=238834 RepID=UPI001CF29B44|nr:Ig-like domain-containing protein [Clostridium estertheticum]MCB2339563.1 Ig-like domain-containing protein [Clostridium estertheticum]